MQSGVQIDTPVTTMDMAGTFLDYAGVDKAPGMTTESLRTMLEGKVSIGQRKWHVPFHVPLRATTTVRTCGPGTDRGEPLSSGSIKT